MTHLTSFKNSNTETFIPYNPALAAKLGTVPSLVLQLIKNWVTTNANNDKNLINNKYWTYNTIDEWHQYFPGESKSTIKRAFAKLKKEGYLISDNHNKNGFDRTNWYTIDFEKYEKLLKPRKNALVQNEPMEETNLSPSLYTNNNNVIIEEKKEIFDLNKWNPTSKDREEMVRTSGLDDKSIEEALHEFKLHHKAYANKVIQNPEAAFMLWCKRRAEVKRRYVKPPFKSVQQKKEDTKHQDFMKRQQYEMERLKRQFAQRKRDEELANQNLVTAEHISDLVKQIRGSKPC